MKKSLIIFLLAAGLFTCGTKYVKTVKLEKRLESCLVAYWTMDDDAASAVVLDSSGNGYNGTAQQDTEDINAVGIVGGALSFNGATDYVDTTFNTDWFKHNFSITFWAYLLEKADENKAFGIYNLANNHVVSTIYPAESDWKFLYGVDTGGWTATLTLRFNSAFLHGKWVMITYTVEQVGDDIVGKAYVDGVLIDTDTVEFDMSTLNLGANTFYLGGCTFPDMIAMTKGSLDDVRIYSKVLTQDEVDYLYNWGDGP